MSDSNSGRRRLSQGWAVQTDVIRFGDVVSVSGNVEMRFLSAETIEEALAHLSDLGDQAQLLAGGTDIMVQYQRREIDPEVLVHIERIRDLAETRHNNGTVELGALVTHRAVTTNQALASRLPALVQASATVGGWQTQEVGTVAGNVCNASPAADTVPPLLVANAVVHLESSAGGRTLTLEDFLEGRRLTARRPDELVVGLEAESLSSRAAETYLKVGPRSGMEVALVGLATRITLAEDDRTVEDARVAVCSVAPVPFRARKAEAALIGSRLDESSVSEAGALLAASALGIPAGILLSRRPRIYSGVFGRGLFQTLYQPSPSIISCLPLTLEWNALSLALLVCAFAFGGLFWLGVAPLMLTLSRCCLSASRARIAPKYP